ncbi:MAG: DASH family cryptochrome [Candidatus Sericytochromatia bacterium]|nr:DASH family cryptochrome [Candidatus Sericytochromatia bacterium]
MPLALVWYRNDLRTEDHEPLARAVATGWPVATIWVADARLEEQDPLGFVRIGPWRRRFLQECLETLADALARQGHRLHVLRGEPAEILPAILARAGGGRIFACKEPGTEEAAMEIAVERKAQVDWAWGKTLIHPDDLPMAPAALPRVYTTFRERVERAWRIRAPLPAPLLAGVPAWPGEPGFPEGWTRLAGRMAALPVASGGFRGGFGFGQARMERVMEAAGVIDAYVETRNTLMDVDHSSRLSPWLSTGALSPRTVEVALAACERERGGTPSTVAFRRELLWRDFFQYVALQQGRRLFFRAGFRDSHGLPDEMPGDRERALQAFESWRRGESGEPLVDAAMRELGATGWLSNRARQWAAWYLARRLPVPWTWGARWFSACLVDDDVASNWGNWAYLAGVGNDPRPDRRFDLAWQAERYDPAGAWQRHWGVQPAAPEP